MTAYLVSLDTDGVHMVVHAADRKPAQVHPGVRDLGTLLDIAERTAPGTELVLLLSTDVMARLGLPEHCPPSGTWPGLDAVRVEHCWQVSRLAPWATFWRPTVHQHRTVVHVGFGPWALDVGRCPFLAGPATTAQALARFDGWQASTGRAWRGTPGVAGVALLRARFQGAGGAAQHRPDMTPRWQIPDHPIPQRVIRSGLERDYTKSWDPGALEIHAHRHEYDTNMAYLAAAMVVRVARHTPERIPRLSLDERRAGKLAGWFLIDVDPWQDTRLPDPAGLQPARRDTGPRWVTGPTLDLLDELREGGWHGGYTILDAWAAPGFTILRPWAELLRDVIAAARRTDDAPTVAAGKAAYREAIGLMGRPGGLLYRPDWQSAVVAQNRVNLWRKLRTTGTRTGHWPVMIDRDAATYATDQPDGSLFAVELGFSLSAGQLGAWKLKGSTTAAATDTLEHAQ